MLITLRQRRNSTETLHDAAFATLGAIRAVAQLEAESMRLAALAEVEQDETSVERAARLLDGGGIEKIVDSKEVELWTDRVGRVLPEQPSNISDYGDKLVIPSPAGSRTPTTSSTWEVQRWRFQKERFYPRKGGSYVDPFAESVIVPGLAAGLDAIWEGKRHFKSDPSDLLQEIELAFERLATQRAQLIDKKSDRGEQQERLIPIAQVPFEIARQKAKKADWVD